MFVPIFSFGNALYICTQTITCHRVNCVLQINVKSTFDVVFPKTATQVDVFDKCAGDVSIFIYVYARICMCVCVCVCVRFARRAVEGVTQGINATIFAYGQV